MRRSLVLSGGGANLAEAVRQGVDEIWVIWTVEPRSERRGGAWNHLGHIFEMGR